MPDAKESVAMQSNTYVGQLRSLGKRVAVCDTAYWSFPRRRKLSLIQREVTMTAYDILQLIRRDAESFHLSGSDALPAFAEIVAELSGRITAEDLTTLIAIGSVVYRAAGAQDATGIRISQRQAAGNY
jgi:hypothetical protein